MESRGRGGGLLPIHFLGSLTVDIMTMITGKMEPFPVHNGKKGELQSELQL